MSGALVVARLELTMRVRAGRWRWLCAVWLLVLFGFTFLLWTGLRHLTGFPLHERGAAMYGALELFSLALALFIVPALSAQSVNGDRERGTLAVLQVTRLSALEIATGKLLGAWAAAAVFVIVSAPLVGWCMLEGGVPALRVLVVSIVMILLLGTVCAVALAFSALLSRSTTSSVFSYLAVFGLTVGTLVVFGLATAATASTQVVHLSPPPGAAAFGGPASCCTATVTVDHTDHTWWLLAPNPFVVLADAAPVTSSGPGGVNPLGAIGRDVRHLRQPAQPTLPVATFTSPRPPGGLVWPYGLVFDVALAAGLFALATRRLRTPVGQLPRGVRIA